MKRKKKEKEKEREKERVFKRVVYEARMYEFKSPISFHWESYFGKYLLLCTVGIIIAPTYKVLRILYELMNLKLSYQCVTHSKFS